MLNFTGNMVALATPFRNGRLDLESLSALVEHVIQGGVSAVIPCGTTGESPTLSHDEHDQVVSHVVECVAGRVMVIAGAGSNSTQEAIRLTKAAQKEGANAVLSVNPYYNKPTQAGMLQHFRAVADASSLPVVLYNIPGRCGVELSVATCLELASHPNIQAMKEATGNVENVTQLCRDSDLAVLSGDDSLTLPMMALGASGVISVLSNVLPDRVTRMVQAALDSDLATARKEHNQLFPLMKALFLESNPAPAKACLAQMGLMADELRLPLCPVGDGTRKILQDLFAPFLAGR